jgi:hypothetical protein
MLENTARMTKWHVDAPVFRLGVIYDANFRAFPLETDAWFVELFSVWVPERMDKFRHDVEVLANKDEFFRGLLELSNNGVSS